MQNAIRQNVSDYLLKTSRPDEIIRTVLKVKQRIEQKRAIQSKDRDKDIAEQHRMLERLVVVGPTSDVNEQLISEMISTIYEGNQNAKSAKSLQAIFLAAEGWGSMNNSQSLLLFAVNNVVNELLNCISFVQKNRVVVIKVCRN